jgi:hypothetical protein
MKKILSFEEFVNESLNESYSNSDKAIIDRAYLNEAASNISIFFYLATGTLDTITTNKIFDPKKWRKSGLDERLSRDWTVYVKDIKSLDKAESEIDSIIKKFPRNSSVTYQSGVSDHGDLRVIKGSYNTYNSIEGYFERAINKLVNESLDESFTDDAWQKFLKEREKIFKGIQIEINARVSEEDELKFVFPFLNMADKFPDDNKGLKARIKWLKGVTFINVEIQNKKPVGYNVYYSGTIETDYGTEEFTDINNGFSMGMG